VIFLLHLGGFGGRGFGGGLGLGGRGWGGRGLLDLRGGGRLHEDRIKVMTGQSRTTVHWQTRLLGSHLSAEAAVAACIGTISAKAAKRRRWVGGKGREVSVTSYFSESARRGGAGMQGGSLPGGSRWCPGLICAPRNVLPSPPCWMGGFHDCLDSPRTPATSATSAGASMAGVWASRLQQTAGDKAAPLTKAIRNHCPLSLRAPATSAFCARHISLLNLLQKLRHICSPSSKLQ
jgi:hypothetical protein